MSSGQVQASLKTAPDFTLESYDHPGESITLSSLYQEAPVVLVFWATWCPTCVSEIPEINRFVKRTAGLGVKVLGVNIEESRRRIERLESRFPMDYDSVLDENAEVSELYDIESLPTVVVLAKGGEILYYGFHLPQDLERRLQVQS